MVELIWDGKYDATGKRTAPLRVALPFQTVETVNESAQQRQKSLFSLMQGEQSEWRNRLIWGDKKYVLPSLLPEFAGKVDLIYIDPPFATGADFSFQAQVGEEEFEKTPSIVEQKAYRDTWGRGLDSYLTWFYDTVTYLHELLAENGSVFVHLDWHTGHYAKAVLDEIFGAANYVNEIVWWYYNKFQGNVNRFAADHDTIFWYAKGERYKFESQQEERDEPTKQIKRKWDGETGKLVNVKGEDGKVEYQIATHKTVGDVWRISMLQPADKTQNVGYPTQKPEALLERIIKASSSEGDLVLDCFCGSGTTAAVAEKLGCRWITCDLGRFAIHTARKRLLAIPDVKPFVVQNLGKYERQVWQRAEFGENAAALQHAYRRFILDLYHADPLEGFSWLHGLKAGRYVHVGAVDSPVTRADVQLAAAELRRAQGTGAKAAAVDMLGWEFALDMNETVRQEAEASGVSVRFLKIPREVLEKKAVEQGDIHFFELAALGVETITIKHEITVKLTDFMVPRDDVPADVQQAVKQWSDWIDYWAVDWDYKDDTFHNQWQSYRTRKDRTLLLQAQHLYEEPGEYDVLVKVIDILGNDTTKAVRVRVE
ncbi:MAG: site-specific DNA-methyltransferase [Anaerolineae bacterium]